MVQPLERQKEDDVKAVMPKKTLESIRAMARTLVAMRDQGRLYTLVLGAGCSIPSGLPSFPDLKRLIVKNYGMPSDKSIDDAFDQLWENSDSAQKYAWLSAWFENDQPSKGYAALAELIRRGYFRTIISFNIDYLVERALSSLRFSKYITIINGITQEDKLQELLTADDPTVRIVKVHGDYRFKTFYLATSEILEFVEPFRGILRRIGSENLMIVGYSFNDWDWTKELDVNGGSIYYADIRPPNAMIRALMKRRRSSDNFLQVDFDVFMNTLRDSIREIRGIPMVQSAPLRRKSLSRSFTVLFAKGLHARQAAAIVQIALQFECDLSLEYEGMRVSIKSIMGILTLGVTKGARVTMHAYGSDAQEAIVRFTDYFESINSEDE